jgi:hypothetical protein
LVDHELSLHFVHVGAQRGPWEEGYRRYREYVEQNGAHVLSAYKTPDGYRLGQWSSAQRAACAKGELDPERERRLRELGWVPRLKPGPRGKRRMRDRAARWIVEPLHTVSILEF